MRLGAFCITKNEAQWIGFSVMSTKDFTDEYVYFDGNSTDGTVELLKYIRDKYKVNIKVFEDQDPKNLKDDYVRVFNECIKQVKSKYAWFLHPDMIVTKAPLMTWDPLAWSVKVRSFAGEPRETIYEFKEGRTDRWKAIMLNDLGLHYHGHYGAGNEDMYFKDLTGDEHTMFENFASYPYEIRDSGIELNHYSDVRGYARRYHRMLTCIKHQYQGIDNKAAEDLAYNHPRVSFVPNPSYGNFELEKCDEVPEVFSKYAVEFAAVCGKTPEEFCYLPLKKEPVNA
jgi:hypothetical protein